MNDTAAYRQFHIEYSPSLPSILREMGGFIALSTYQAGKLILLGVNDEDNLFQIPLGFKKPMGIAFRHNKMAIATLDEVMVFSHSGELAKGFPQQGKQFDRLYFPRATFYTGIADLHDISFGKDALWAVNTLYSCLVTFDLNYNFRPRWKPPFVDNLVPHDLCHLNGLAMEDERPAYVTSLGSGNTKRSWRDDIVSGGLLMDVRTNEILLKDLAMPHSPRLFDGQLYFLQSATGELVRLNPSTGETQSLLKISGFVRGMTKVGHYIIIGLSEIRKSSKTFNKLPVSQMADNAGFVVVDSRSWKQVAELKYLSTVKEIYDIQFMEGVQRPGLFTSDDPRHKDGIMIPGKAFWRQRSADKS